MPTVGWIAEDATERFSEARHRPLPPTPAPLPVRCQVCGRTFRTNTAFVEHVSREHPLELPSLYVHGQPLLREHVVRTPLTRAQVSVAPCTYCEVRIDGAHGHRFSPGEFCERFSQAREGAWEVRLVHERPADASRAETHHYIRFRIPDAANLNLVDQRFREVLVRDELRPEDLERFARAIPGNEAAREYGAALGDYALAIILKEQRTPLRSHVGLDEFATKMQSALAVLCQFNRPVALAVCASIRFNLNSFIHEVHVAERMVELGAGFGFFRQITCEAADVLPGHTSPAAFPVSTPICPIDAVSHRLLSACDRMVRRELTPEDMESLLRVRTEHPLTEQDLVKIHVLCAEGFLRLGRAAEATEHLRALQHAPVFKDWARTHLSASQPNNVLHV